MKEKLSLKTSIIFDIIHLCETATNMFLM